jgi:regulator of cell morphogenesis and NO signaling
MTPLKDSLYAWARRPLREIVRDDARTAPVLERFGLDYCCHGHQTLEEAAAARGIALEDMLPAFEPLSVTPAERLSDEWTELDALSRHIVARHHRYVRETLPIILGWLDKLVARHGEQHPELQQVREVFVSLATDLTSHMAKEENILFPAIDDLAAAHRAGDELPKSPFGTILHPVRVMETDHRHAGDLLTRLRDLTAGYTPPADGCTTYRSCYEELHRFETDLHRHIHLENNVLFPAALELEERLS